MRSPGTSKAGFGYFIAFAIGFFAVAGTARSEAPNLRTPAPVIYLADNLDEKDRLGFCIDTVGRGFSDRLHLHSCKPRGGDVQFRFDADTGHIASAAFRGKCAALTATPAPDSKLALLDCADDPNQHFDYRQGTGEFRPQGDPELCLAAGPSSRSAGPFMARDLVLARCATTPSNRKRWTIKE